MLLAESSSDAVQIAAMLFAFLGSVLTAVMTYLVMRLNQKQTEAAVEAEKVKVALVQSNALTTARLDSVAEKVEEVHKATNSMKDALVLATEKEALERGHAAGVKQEQDRERPK